MKKVFFNDRFIVLTNKIPVNTDIPFIQIENLNVLKEYIANFDADSSVQTLYIVNPDLKVLFEKFKKCFMQIEASGGVVRNSAFDTLFIHRLGKWDLPKGKLEKNETIEENALREVCEETGISHTKLSITSCMEPTYHTYHLKNDFILKKTNWFTMRYNGNEKLVPQTEEHIQKVCWLDQNATQLAMNNTYASIKEVIKHASDMH